MLSNCYAQYPIPSYKVPVSRKANFQENQVPGILEMDTLIYGKRTIVVHAENAESNMGECSATIWVYSLDGKTRLGPYTVNCGETLYVDIDDRDWGVYVQSNDQVIISVWIEYSQGDMPAGKKLPGLKPGK